MKLVSRATVKDLASIARADRQLDRVLDNMIHQVSEEVETMTYRSFLKQVRTEYHTSYDQFLDDPDPQFIFLAAYPVDINVSFSIVWAVQMRHAEVGVTLVAGTDYVLEGETGLVRVTGASSLPFQLPVYASGIPRLAYSSTGFKVDYTGGYAYQTVPAAAKASGIIRFGANPTVGSTIQLGGVTWTFVAGAPSPNQTTVQGSLAATLAQLVTDLNAFTDPPINAATYSAVSGTDLVVSYDQYGAIGNLFRLKGSGQVGPVGDWHLTGGVNQSPVDPLFESDVIGAPMGLQALIAGKIVRDLQTQKEKGMPLGFVTPWLQEEERQISHWANRYLL